MARVAACRPAIIAALVTAGCAHGVRAERPEPEAHYVEPVHVAATEEHLALAAAPLAASADDLEDIRWLTAILMNPNVDGPARTGAAVRLLNMRLPAAIEPLREALLSGDAALMLAVIEALGETQHAAPELLEPLVRALRNPPTSVLSPLAMAIARYGDPALEKVREMARREDLPEAQRLGAIFALGSFRNQPAAVELMALLEREQAEEVIAAICDALRRGTGLPYGNNPTDWQRWWREAVNQPPEQWLTNLVQRLAEQLAVERQHTQREHEAAAALERRFGEFLREYFPLIRDEEEQMRRLRSLMEDRLASVRLFAVDRVARLLRDSIKIADEVQVKLTELLEDEDAEIRRRTARLLDQLNVESAGERIAQRLSVETSPEVAVVLLDLVAKRPTPAALEPLCKWITDASATTSARAAAVAWEAAGNLALDEDQVALLRAAVASATRWRELPEHARLLAAVGDTDDLRQAESLLDHDDPTFRRAVAEAFLRRTLRQPLLDRAGDDVIYPFAIRSLARDPVDMAAARRAVSLRPATESGRTMWSESIVKIAGKLSAEAIIELDDLLAEIRSGEGTPQLRADVLARGRALPNDAVDSTLRAEIQTRLASQYLALDQPLAAHEAMEGVNGPSLNDAARTVRFEAAVLSRHYDLAVQLFPGPEPWMALLARIAERRAPGALDLRDEIDRRFAERLEGDLKDKFNRLSERIARERAEAPADPPA